MRLFRGLFGSTRSPEPRWLTTKKLAALTRTETIPLSRATPPQTIEVKLSVVDLALPGDVHFAEHVRGETGAVTDEIILLGPHHIYASNDFCATWRAIDAMKIARTPLQRCFTTSAGTHLVQGMGWAQAADEAKSPEELAPILRFDKNWRLISVVKAGDVHWHGTASIGEANGTIMFAEYPDNFEAYRESDPAPHLRPSRVWRSRDDGQTWQCIFTAGSGTIRHLHTCLPDPARPRTWWLSSGDRTAECFVWRSEDDGDSWIDVTNTEPDVNLPRSMNHRKRSAQRFTDLHFHGDYLIWGADDPLGDLDAIAASSDDVKAGSRMYRAKLNGEHLALEELGLVGLPVRSLIDVGPAWIILTEAKQAAFSLRPQVCVLFKDEMTTVHTLFDIENFGGHATGFTYSVASRSARNGVFFSNRNSQDGFPSGVAALRWEVMFR